MDIVRLYQDFSVDFVTEGHKHARPGWANTECPWCTGDHIGYHLGFNIDSNYYFCWRCGWHPITPTLSKILNIRETESREIVRQYGLLLARRTEQVIPIEKKIEFKLPTGVTPLSDGHKVYLSKRGYDPDRLEQIWGLMSTGPTSVLDDFIEYRNRILIPFHWDYQMVSFDTRLALNKASHEKRYKACPKGRELIPHKHILYGRQDEWRETGICVEGPTDVWRLGTCSFATSGIQYTPEQVRVIARTFKRVWVIYDPESQAQVQADRLVAELKFRGIKAETMLLGQHDDPGSMKQEEADYLVKQLIK